MKWLISNELTLDFTTLFKSLQALAYRPEAQRGSLIGHSVHLDSLLLVFYFSMVFPGHW